MPTRKAHSQNVRKILYTNKPLVALNEEKKSNFRSFRLYYSTCRMKPRLRTKLFNLKKKTRKPRTMILFKLLKSVHQNSGGRLVKAQNARLHPLSSLIRWSGVGPSICISTQFLGAGLGPPHL